MKSSVKLRPDRWDLAVVAAVLALAVFCGIGYWSGGSSEGDLTAVVSIAGAEADRVVLSGTGAVSGSVERTYANNGYTLHVTFSQKGVRVTSADCPNQDCVHTGIVASAGQSIVCLPSRISIQLVRQGSGGSGDVDAVIG